MIDLSLTFGLLVARHSCYYLTVDTTNNLIVKINQKSNLTLLFPTNNYNKVKKL